MCSNCKHHKKYKNIIGYYAYFKFIIITSMHLLAYTCIVVIVIVLMCHP